jgi:hypothetical protein
MMRRLFWLGMGMTIGALIVHKITRMMARLTPSSLAESLRMQLSDFAYAAREFALDVRDAMAEREAELRQAATEQATPKLHAVPDAQERTAS